MLKKGCLLLKPGGFSGRLCQKRPRPAFSPHSGAVVAKPYVLRRLQFQSFVCLPYCLFSVAPLFAQIFPSPYKVQVHGQNTIIFADTPAGWSCDYAFAEFADAPCAFLKSDAYSADGINTTHYMYIYFEEGRPLAPEEYLKQDLEQYKSRGVDAKAEQVEFVLPNTDYVEAYALYEFSGLPTTYRELVFIAKTNRANVVFVYGYMVGDDAADISEDRERRFVI
jgi:hypothetical protein